MNPVPEQEHITDPILLYILNEFEIGDDLEWGHGTGSRYEGSNMSDHQHINLKFKSGRNPYLISFQVMSDKDYLEITHHQQVSIVKAPLSDPDLMKLVESYIIWTPHRARFARGDYDD